VVTLGVDLAASDDKTAACLIRWAEGKATVEDHVASASDTTLVELGQRADKIGIDVPFGWPRDFVGAVNSHHKHSDWPDVDKDHLRYRATDREVYEKTGRPPLSVSSDRIAVPAMRAAPLLTRMAGPTIDRAGMGKLVEVYPAAALRRWNLVAEGYKGKKAKKTAKRLDLVKQVIEKAGDKLQISAKARAACEDNDNVLDAVIAAFVARAKAAGLCDVIPEAAQDFASEEGWIALPATDSFPRLFE
jgi:hypothetical protein